MVKEWKSSFFYIAHNVLLTPLPCQFCFPPPPSPQFLSFSLLLHNFIVFPSPPPPPHLFYIFFHPQIHRPPIDRTSTLHRPLIVNTASWIVKLYTTTTTTFLLFSLHHHHTITTATTFLLFSLHRHHHHLHCHHISIVFPPPGGGGGKTIGSRESGVDYLRQLWQVHTVLSDFLRKLLLQWN